MDDLSMYILDISMNSIRANSTEINLVINEDLINNKLSIFIKDNGDGMETDIVKTVTDPFYTTRTTRKIGLGLSLFKMHALGTDGYFDIKSQKNIGTSVKAWFKYDHIDRVPMGNIAETVFTLCINNSNCDIFYEHIYNGNSFVFSTVEVKSIIGDLPFTNYDVMKFIKNYINENIDILKKEVT